MKIKKSKQKAEQKPTPKAEGKHLHEREEDPDEVAKACGKLPPTENSARAESASSPPHREDYMTGAESEITDYKAYALAPGSLWANCRNGALMLKALRIASGEPESDMTRKVVGVAAECARLALPVWQKKYPDDDRPAKTLEACVQFAEGRIGLNELEAAGDAAYYARPTFDFTDLKAGVLAFAAFSVTSAADASRAAYAAAYVASYNAACIAAADADVYEPVFDAPFHAVIYTALAVGKAGLSSKMEVVNQCAHIVRKWFPDAPQQAVYFLMGIKS